MLIMVNITGIDGLFKFIHTCTSLEYEDSDPVFELGKFCIKPKP